MEISKIIKEASFFSLWVIQIFSCLFIIYRTTTIKNANCVCSYINIDLSSEFEQALGVGEQQGSLVCCSPWGHKESDTAEWLKNNTEGRGAHMCALVPRGCWNRPHRWTGLYTTGIYLSWFWRVEAQDQVSAWMGWWSPLLSSTRSFSLHLHLGENLPRPLQPSSDPTQK